MVIREPHVFFEEKPHHRCRGLRFGSPRSGRQPAQEAGVRRLREFIQVQNLGVYGKARINLKVVERLREHGYDEDFLGRIKDYLLLEAR